MVAVLDQVQHGRLHLYEAVVGDGLLLLTPLQRLRYSLVEVLWAQGVYDL